MARTIGCIVLACLAVLFYPLNTQAGETEYVITTNKAGIEFHFHRQIKTNTNTHVFHYDGHTYVFLKRNFSYGEAQRLCQIKRGKLAQIETSAEEEFLTERAKELHYRFFIYGGYVGETDSMLQTGLICEYTNLIGRIKVGKNE